eukprot:9486997-Pyramimonas_sp.AAC.1
MPQTIAAQPRTSRSWSRPGEHSDVDSSSVIPNHIVKEDRHGACRKLNFQNFPMGVALARLSTSNSLH